MNYAGTTLLERATGKFYTPPLIADSLVNNMLELGSLEWAGEVRILDPFCGDGRLLVAFIRRVCELHVGRNIRWHVAFWDYDSTAVEKARCSIADAAQRYGIDVTLQPFCGDSFFIDQAHFNTYDCVITNPPWEAIKPDSRELAGMVPSQQEDYCTALQEYDQRLSRVLPHSQPLKKFAGWGTNLSRCGAELALNLVRDNGLCGIVTPLSLLTDQISAPLRRWFLAHTKILAVTHYPAETRLFTGVDQECVAITFQKSPATYSSILLTNVSQNMKTASSHIELSIEQLQQTNYCLPVSFGNTLFELLPKWTKLGTFAELEHTGSDGLWAGRELDETRHTEYLAPSGQFSFLKGKMVGRYKFIESPSKFVREEKRKIPDSALYHRIAWRDVSRRSQARRMQAAVILPKVVTGNSLHVAYFRDNHLDRLRALLVIMNSIPFEYQVRALLGTGHISLGVVRRVRIPKLNDQLVETLSSLLCEYEHGTPEGELWLELAVAQAYGLTRHDYEKLLIHFDGLPPEYISSLLTHYTPNN